LLFLFYVHFMTTYILQVHSPLKGRWITRWPIPKTSRNLFIYIQCTFHSHQFTTCFVFFKYYGRWLIDWKFRLTNIISEHLSGTDQWNLWSWVGVWERKYSMGANLWRNSSLHWTGKLSRK
jgi:hypothetical protein